jgi:glutamate dehydrogenase
MRSFAHVVGPDRDIPAPDVYTTPQIMAWMADEYGKIVGKPQLAVITGKPVEQDGSLGRDTATAKGAFFVLLEAAKRKGLGKGATVAVQGFGNAGLFLAQFCHDAGFKVVAVSDSKGGIYDPAGLDIAAMIAAKEKGSVQDAHGKRITNAELLELPVDIIAPAALENQLTKENASRIKAKIVLEVANGPTTPDADKILHDKGVLVVPDVLANSGGVTVSYFEWVQNKKHERWTEEQVAKKLQETIVPAFTAIWHVMEEKKTTMRDAAFISAVERIATAIDGKNN